MSLARVSPAACVGESGAQGPRYALSLASCSELTVNSCSSNSYLRELIMHTSFRILRPTLSARPFVQAMVAFGFMLLFGFSLTALAQAPKPPLTFFKNYIVTGDVVVGGVGLRGLGDATGFATGTINIPDTGNYANATAVPAGADIVAAFLYWQSVEKSQSAFAGQNGFFNGHAITGRVLGNPNAPTSWSAGGCSGSAQGTKTLRTYRADVRPFLNTVNGTAQGNGSYQVRLADSGSNGGGVPLTLGATLVLIYRVVSPAIPLNAITLYEGSFAPSNSSQIMDLTMQGFYHAASSPGPVATITHIVGNGQPNKPEALSFNGTVLSASAFPGLLNGSWDSPTFDVSALVPAGDLNPVDTTVTPAATNSGCVSWGAVVFSTTVQQSDNDGLLDIWKINQGYTDFSNGEFVSLPGAARGEQDIFIQIDWLASHDFITSGGAVGHTHKLKKDALDMVGDAFNAQGIHLHIDCGNCYPGDAYVIPGGLGGNVIDEDTVTCEDNPAAVPPFFCAFPGVPVTSWKGGFTFLKNHVINPQTNQLRFQHGREHSHREGIFAHALGVATNIFSISKGSLISIVVSGATATVTTSSPHGLNSGDRVTVSGAISPVPVAGEAFTLNATYPGITVTSPTTFTFNLLTNNVPAGTYANSGLFVASGPPLSISGWGDPAGADFIVTLGLWRSDVAADDQVGSVRTQAGTFMHELGHNLGLKHGGGDNTNCKPNFQSVMNYLFQVRLLPGFDGLAHVDYSGQILPDLNEGSLDESPGIGAAATKYRTRWFAPLSFLDKQVNTQGGRAATRHCDGTPITDGAQMVRLEGPLVAGPIDWNNDGNTSESSLSQDINFNGIADPPFIGFNDWGKLNLGQISARRGVFGFSGDVWGTLDDGTGGTLDDGTGGTLDDGTGGTLDDGTGGTLDDGTGGLESDFDRANSTVDPPLNVTAAQVGHNVVLNWTPPDFGRIRTYLIWRANTTNGPISSTNLPVNIGKVTGTPPLTTFTDTTDKNGNTYTYFLTAALGADSGRNNGNQSGPSNMVSVAVKF